MEALGTDWPIAGIFFTRNWWEKNQKLLASVTESTPQFEVDARWLAQAATTDHPDGVVGIARLPESYDDHLSTELLDWSLTVAADAIQDPGNAGTLIRMTAAMGANRMFLSPDSVSPLHPKLLRSTAGLWFRSPPRVAALETLLPYARQRGVQILAAGQGGDAIWSFDLRKPTMFILGNEGAGIRPEIKKLTDAICTVPMARHVESLNVATAGTILLYEAMRQRESLATQPPDHNTL
jgi:TrmH family RNA methyltransferase